MSVQIPLTPSHLTAKQRKALTAVGDALIPRSDDRPSASDAAVPSKWVDEVLSARPDMTSTLQAVLDAYVAESVDPMRFTKALRVDQPDSFFVLCEVVAGGYFLNPEIRDLIGYPGQLAVHEQIEASDLEDLVAPVKARGTAYRTL